MEGLAQVLRESGFQMRPALRALFRSAAFYAAPCRANRIKSPVELVVGTARLLRIDPGESPALAAIAGGMGQDLFLPPSVKGWDGESWISTSTVYDRYNFARPLIAAPPRPSPAGRARKAERGPAGRPAGRVTDRPADRPAPGARKAAGAPGRPGLRILPRWDPAALEREVLGPAGLDASPSELVDRVARWLLASPLDAKAKEALVDFVRSAPRGARLPRAAFPGLVHLVLSSPEYQME